MAEPPPTSTPPPRDDVGTPLTGREPDPTRVSVPPAAPASLAADPGWPVLTGYEILGELGRGGMGVVYKARDLKRGQVVALKTMRQADASALYRFKQEFRTLADVTHANLVTLYELVADGPLWFFTMELIEGSHFLAYVRAGADVSAGMTTAEAPSSSEPRPSSGEGQGAPGPPVVGPSVSLGRLRDALRQVAEGVAALHAAGKLHRDVKPSNVLVTPAGRVVLLDFGLATELGRSGLYESAEQRLVGTIAYMAPEQGAGRPVSPASDWYSVGAMLYQALTGQPPFSGAALEVLRDKEEREPPPPEALVAGVPEDLNALCADLLRRLPEARPPGHEVLRRLAGGPAAPPAAVAAAPAPEAPFVGRERQLQSLHEAFRAVEQGRAVTVLVHGRSGMGKSALVQHFLDGLVVRQEAVALAGRCYQQESVPYKAFDSLVDSLSRYLGRLPRAEAEALLPRDVGPLARVFPVLRRVQAVAAAAARRPLQAPDVQELRRRAFAALRELLARLGDRRPLVLAIDDLQWGDVDSAGLLADLLQPPDPPALLLLGCYRSEEVATSPFLRTFLRAQQEVAAPDRRELAVEALDAQEARQLALQLLGRTEAEAQAQADTVARESGGHAFWVYELVHYLQAGGPSAGPPGAVTVDQVLWARVRGLPEAARRLLEVVAVAGRPLPEAAACRAAGLGADERAALAVLRTGRMLRSTGLAEGAAVETYHDRVRETVTAHLADAERGGCHRRLAEALEAEGPADPEFLAVHWQGAGERARAGEYYARAAARAAETLAFDRAARLYRLALELGPGEEDRLRALRGKLGEALANAGRGAEAARAYQAAAEGAPAADAFEVRRRAAEQFLISGHIDEGIRTLRDVLGAVGLRWPENPLRALLACLARWVQLGLRGLGFRERPADQVPPGELLRIDVCWSVVVGLVFVDYIRGSYFQARHLLFALRAGEPYRLSRALGMEAGFVSTTGRRGRERGDRLLESALALAERIQHPHALGLAVSTAGFLDFMAGRWRRSHERYERAEELLRERCSGVAWELDTARLYGLYVLEHLGEWKEESRRLPPLLKDARERGDLFAETLLRLAPAMVVHLAADDPEGAQEEVDQAVAGWSQQGFHFQHYSAAYTQMHLTLYRGEGRAAWEFVRERWPALRRSLYIRIPLCYVETLHLRARAALLVAAGAAPSERRAFLGRAERDARRMEGARMPWCAALARLLRAGIAAARGRTEAAVGLLTDAEAGFEATDMALCAAAARRRRGEVLGGDTGAALVADADSWMAAQEIRNPARMTGMLAPGFDGR